MQSSPFIHPTAIRRSWFAIALLLSLLGFDGWSASAGKTNTCAITTGWQYRLSPAGHLAAYSFYQGLSSDAIIVIYEQGHYKNAQLAFHQRVAEHLTATIRVFRKIKALHYFFRLKIPDTGATEGSLFSYFSFL